MSLISQVLGSKVFELRETNTASSLDQNRIAIRNNNEVFFAYNSSIRVSKLSAEDSSYRLLDVQFLDFEVENIRLNSSGTLLAIYNHSNLIIASLPSSLIPSTSLVQVKSFKIATDLFRTTKILSLLWNKVSKNDSNLVVLTDDSQIRTFDPFFSINQPQSIYNLNSTNQKFGLLTNKVESPVAITFGSSERLSGALTLYVLNKEGDLFAIYPFLPKSISVSRDSIEELINESVILTDSIADEDKNKKKQAINQLRLVTKLWKQVPTAQLEIRGIDELLVLNSNFIDSFYIQGPFAIQPYPVALYEDNGANVLTVSSDYVDLLVVSFTKSGLGILLPDSSLKMKWEEDYESSDDDNDDDISLTLLEFKRSQGGLPTYISTFNKNSILVQNGNKINELDFSGSIQLLDKSLREGKPELLLDAKFVSNSIQQFGGDYVGSGILKDSIGGVYSLVLQTKEVRIELNKEQIMADKGAEDKEQEGHVPEYKTLLRESSPEDKERLNKLKSFKLRLPKNYGSLLQDDENSLIDLNDVSQQVLKQLILYHKSGLDLNYRLSDQEAELQRQIDKSFEVLKKFEDLNDKKDSKIKYVGEVLAKQTKLNQRFERLGLNLSNSLDLPISSREKQWFKEIQSLTLSFNKSVKRNVVLNEQLTYIKSELKTKPALDKKNSQDWSELNDILKNGKKLIDQTSKSLERNLGELDEQLGNVHI